MNIDLIRKIDRIHPYPAKFPIDFAIEYIQKYSKKGDLIYDPFLGSGTSLFAARLLGRNGYGTDINYIALLISKFKLLDLGDNELSNLEVFISNFSKNYNNELNSVKMYNYPSIAHWFCEDSIKVLSLIKKYTDLLSDENEKKFCKLVMSSIINTVSNQESDTRYAAIYKPKINVDYVASQFIRKFLLTLNLCKDLKKELTFNVKNIPLLLDAKKCTTVIKENSVDLILTSPPYPNSYDYYLYHKHRMNWLGYDVKFSMNNEIGSRREFSSLKHSIEKFDNDMYLILKECDKTLKNRGIAVIVIGDGKIRGERYDANTNISNICSRFNWSLVDYKYSMLDDTSRSFQQSYRTKGKKEHILVFKKGV